MQRPLRENARSAGRDTAEVCDARLVDLGERVEHRANQDVATVVRLEDVLVGLWIGAARLPDAVLVSLAQGVADAVGAADRLTELGGDGPERTRLMEVAAHLRDLRAQHVARPEMLKHRDEIGEGLVERHHVGIGAGVERDVHTHQQGVGDSCAMTSCDSAVNTIVPKRRRLVGLEVAEAQSDLGIEIGVLTLHVVRADLQRPPVTGPSSAARAGARRPVHRPPSARSKFRDRPHADRVDHLLAEGRFPSEAGRPSCASRSG